MKSCVVSFDHLFKDLRYEILRCMFLSNLGRLTQRIADADVGRESLKIVSEPAMGEGNWLHDGHGEARLLIWNLY